MVRAHIATLRGAPAGAPPRPPTVRQVTGWLTRHPTTLNEEDRAGPKEVLARCPELDTAAGHVRDFGRLGSTLSVRRGQGYTLRVSAIPSVHRGLLAHCQPLDGTQGAPIVPAQRKARREYENRVNAFTEDTP